MNNSGNGSGNQSDEVVCTPSFVFPAFSAGIDARQTFANFVQHIPVSNQQQLSQQQIVKFSKFNQKNHGLSQEQKHLVQQNLSQSQLLAATISLPQSTLQQQQQIQHTHLLQPVSHDVQNELLNNAKSQQAAVVAAAAAAVKEVTGNGNQNGNNNNTNNGATNNSNNTSNNDQSSTGVIWACPSCKVPFKTASELQSHLSSAHAKSEKSVPCEQCGKLFASAERVKIHVKVAHGTKSSQCHICGSSFSYKCKLLDHMRTHTGDKPFQCDICGRKFSQKNHVRRHRMIHTGERPFSCDFCGRGFYRKDKLSRHRLIHTNPSSRKSKASSTNASSSAQANRTTQTVEMSLAATSRPNTLNNDTLTMQNAVSQYSNGSIPLIPVQLSAQQWIASNSLNGVQNGESLNNKLNTSALINAAST